MPLLETRELTAFYGDFQALYGIDTALEPGETIAIIGANGAGKSTFLKAIAGLITARARQRPARRRADRRAARGRHRQARHRAGAGGAAAVSLADGRGEPADRRLRPQDARGLDARSASIRCFRSLKERRAAPRQTLVGRAAADGGDRPRADVQSAHSPVRRDQPRARADRHRRHLRGAAADQGRTAPASCWSSRTSCRR